jgi:hypothetical protein
MSDIRGNEGKSRSSRRTTSVTRESRCCTGRAARGPRSPLRRAAEALDHCRHLHARPDRRGRGRLRDADRERGLAERSTDPREGRGPRRAREVLHVNDLGVLQSKGLCPPVPVPLLVGPRERYDDAVAARLDRFEREVLCAQLPPLSDSPLENLTGLIGAMSGRWPEPPPRAKQPTPSTPLHLGVNE